MTSRLAKSGDVRQRQPVVFNLSIAADAVINIAIPNTVLFISIFSKKATFNCLPKLRLAKL
jgi:hypothetical protein